MIEILNQALDFLQDGGPVLPVLGALSLWMWGLILIKWLELNRMRKLEAPLTRFLQMPRHLSANHCASPAEATNSAGGQQAETRQQSALCIMEPDQAADWQREIIAEVQRHRQQGLPVGRKSLEGLQGRLQSQLERHVTTILTLAAIAPLLGLFGTVAGMIDTFQGIARLGLGDARVMASGISQALITTQTGLIVAVPGLLIGNFLLRRVRDTQRRVERFCLGLRRQLAPRRDNSPEDNSGSEGELQNGN